VILILSSTHRSVYWCNTPTPHIGSTQMRCWRSLAAEAEV